MEETASNITIPGLQLFAHLVRLGRLLPEPLWPSLLLPNTCKVLDPSRPQGMNLLHPGNFHRTAKQKKECNYIPPISVKTCYVSGIYGIH